LPAMTRRLPLPARRKLAAMERTIEATFSSFDACPPPSALRSFKQSIETSTRSTATETRSTPDRTNSISSADGRVSHRAANCDPLTAGIIKLLFPIAHLPRDKFFKNKMEIIFAERRIRGADKTGGLIRKIKYLRFRPIECCAAIVLTCPGFVADVSGRLSTRNAKRRRPPAQAPCQGDAQDSIRGQRVIP